MVSQEMSFKNMEDFEVQNELDEVETFCGKQQRCFILVSVSVARKFRGESRAQ
jgi:hypothetical protein